jgi:hypothetical protein
LTPCLNINIFYLLRLMRIRLHLIGDVSIFIGENITHAKPEREIRYILAVR